MIIKSKRLRCSLQTVFIVIVIAGAATVWGVVRQGQNGLADLNPASLHRQNRVHKLSLDEAEQARARVAELEKKVAQADQARARVAELEKVVDGLLGQEMQVGKGHNSDCNSSSESRVFGGNPRVQAQVNGTCDKEMDYLGWLRLKPDGGNIERKSMCNDKIVQYWNAADGGFQWTFMRNFSLDFRVAMPGAHRQISQPEDDGGHHDPRLNLEPRYLMCHCPERLQVNGNEWFSMYPSQHRHDFVCTAEEEPPVDATTLDIAQRVLFLTRKDDHNPLFMVSLALNALIIMELVAWRPETTQIAMLDFGCPACLGGPQPLLELFHKALGPSMPLLFPRHFEARRVRFHEAIFAASEFMGPLTQHLDDAQPCARSDLVTDFKRHVLRAFGLPSRDMRQPGAFRLTFATRQNMGGRRLGRVLVNERELAEALRAGLPHAVVRQAELTVLAAVEQMVLMQSSDVLLGMHGAGMYASLWLPEGAAVIEIFPVWKKRWGYRNICQYTGCKYVDFRGGKDTHGDLFYKEIEAAEFVAMVRGTLEAFGLAPPAESY